VGKITQEDHSVYQRDGKDKIAGVSCDCAAAFDAKEETVKNDFDLIVDNAVPGTSGRSTQSAKNNR